MADHLRDQIMAAMVTTLTGLTTTGVNVFPDEDDPVENAELPCLVLLQGGETNEVVTMPTPRLMRAFFDVDVIAYVKRTHAQADVRKKANTICKEVQTAMAGNVSLSGLAKYATLVQTDFELTGEAEKPAAMARMRWQVFYCYAENAPDTPA